LPQIGTPENPVTRVYEKTAAREGFRFFGNVKIGHDIEVEELDAASKAFLASDEVDKTTRVRRPRRGRGHRPPPGTPPGCAGGPASHPCLT
jgi:hypothetical protein